MHRQKMRFYWLDSKLPDGYRTGVSLHSHTSHSRESLNMIPGYARQSRTLALGIRALCSRYKQQAGIDLDFSRPFFTLPLSASEAFRIEAKQIEEDLNLEPIVSLTDHDSIEAPTRLRLFIDGNKAPASMEWTVPFLHSRFHLGIHNLPDKSGVACGAAGHLAREHADRNPHTLDAIFSRLSRDPQTLVVLNHPLWDMAGIGEERHRTLVAAFLGRFARHIHAMEINGLRPWRENLAVMELAERWRLPVISGGDRHGCEPSAILNVTRETTFRGFVDEIRLEKRSEIVFMNQYREPLKLRKIRAAADLLREYPHHPEGRRRWADRIFIPWRDGATVKLSAVMKMAEPSLLQNLVSFVLLLEAKPMQPLLRIAVSKELDVNPLV